MMGFLQIILNPFFAVSVFIAFLIFFFVFLDLEGSFNGGFLHFGPGDDRENTTSFLGIKVDSWTKVLILYAIGFSTGLLTSYYDNVVGESLGKPIFDTSITEIDYSRTGVYTIALIDPLIFQTLKVIEYLTTFTLQFQFILPIILGEYLGDLPYVLNVLRTKTYKTD
jgi:hypothetical protein